MFGGGSSGPSTGYPWNIDVFPFSFRFSEGLGHKYPTLSLSVVLNLAHGSLSIQLFLLRMHFCFSKFSLGFVNLLLVFVQMFHQSYQMP